MGGPGKDLHFTEGPAGKKQTKPVLSRGVQSDADDRKTRETVLSGSEKMSWKGVVGAGEIWRMQCQEGQHGGITEKCLKRPRQVREPVSGPPGVPVPGEGADSRGLVSGVGSKGRKGRGDQRGRIRLGRGHCEDWHLPAG